MASSSNCRSYISSHLWSQGASNSSFGWMAAHVFLPEILGAVSEWLPAANRASLLATRRGQEAALHALAQQWLLLVRRLGPLTQRRMLWPLLNEWVQACLHFAPATSTNHVMEARAHWGLDPEARVKDFQDMIVEAWEFEGEDDQPPPTSYWGLATAAWAEEPAEMRQGLALLAAAGAVVEFYPEHELTAEDDEDVVSEGGLLVLFVLEGYEGSLYIENLFVDPAGFVVL